MVSKAPAVTSARRTYIECSVRCRPLSTEIGDDNTDWLSALQPETLCPRISATKTRNAAHPLLQWWVRHPAAIPGLTSSSRRRHDCLNTNHMVVSVKSPRFCLTLNSIRLRKRVGTVVYRRRPVGDAGIRHRK
ncbi:hypothetical protein B0T09DRAFT_74140 [Sordaria sp. MPI-SDFR-AT-0083]|nr:hypothetical protein B0T09DRAFT_74140 [Sordaria sp. MPI-SDFR-AT-0083]